jgi:hypothetical protein
VIQLTPGARLIRRVDKMKEKKSSVEGCSFSQTPWAVLHLPWFGTTAVLPPR